MKVAIFYVAVERPGAGWASYRIGNPPEAVMLSHGIGHLSAVIKRSHECFMADMRSFAHIDNLEDVAGTLKYDAAVFWVHPRDWQGSRKVASVIARVGPKVPTIVAGPAVSIGALRELPGAGCLLLGEPEEAYERAIAEAAGADWNSPKVIDMINKPIERLDDLPDLDRGIANVEFEKQSPWLVGTHGPVYTFTVGRHCPACYDAAFLGSWFRCRYCCTADGGSSVGRRIKSAQKIADEVYRLSGSHGTGGIGLIAFHDTQFASAAWLRELAREWSSMVRRIPFYMPLDPRAVADDPQIVRDLAKVGMVWTSLDIGNASARVRSMLGVHRTLDEDRFAVEVVKRNRVNLVLRYTTGLPGQNELEMNETEDFLRQAAPQAQAGEYWCPVPGTALYQQCLDRGQLTMERHPEEAVTPPWVKGLDHGRMRRRMQGWPTAYNTAPIEVPVEVPEPALPVRPPVSAPASAPVPPPVPATKWSKGDSRAQRDRLLARDAARAVDGQKPPKVTCIIVSYKRPQFLRDAFHSLEAQTMPKNQWECVIVENGSENGLVNEFVEYKEKHFPNVKVIWHEKNINNVATCWNEALDIAAGEYVCTLDDDNLKWPEFFAKLSSWLDAHPEKDGVYCRSRVIDKQGTPRGYRGRTGEFTLAEELQGNFVDSGELMFRRSAVEKVGFWDERCKACEDWDFVARLTHFANGLGFVDEVLADYRAHDMNRMHTSIELGAAACTELLRSKHTGPRQHLDVKVIAPADLDITQSQRQVIRGIKDGLEKVPFARVPALDPDNMNVDVVLVLAPFRLSQLQIDALKRRLDDTRPRPAVVSVHMEDPQAVIANARMVGISDWIVSNDIAAVRWYGERLTEAGIPDGWRRVAHWNSLGVSETALRAVEASKGCERDIDVLVLGYPYPTRAVVVRDMVKDAPTNWRIAAIGDGWNEKLAGFSRVRTMPTLDEDASLRWACRAKVVVSTHRRQPDIGGFPVMPPESIHRGFLEAASGAAVLVDAERSFGAGRLRLVPFTDGRDAARKAFDLLGNEAKRAAIAAHNQRLALTEYTFAARMTRLLNVVRSQKWGAVIP